MAAMNTTSANPPFVMNILVPFIRHPSPSLRAVVRIAATSEPASGSVTPIAVINSPDANLDNHLSFCSGFPKLVK